MPTVTRLDDSIFALVRDKATGLSKGGMASKLEAARMATTAGESVIIASGRRTDVLTRLFAGEPIGTLLVAQGKSISPLKRWIGFSAQPRGGLILDDGASRAIAAGRSLLAIGVRGVEGRFEKGDVVRLCAGDGREIARGLSNYSSAEIEQIKGQKSDAIAETLGHRPYKAIVHCDNMAVVGRVAEELKQ
jgi:glutamate 5-kinase